MSTPWLPATRECGAELRARRARLLDRIRTVLQQSGDPAKRSFADRLGRLGAWVDTVVFTPEEIAFLGEDFGALVEIDAALRRLADGSYGRCTSCGAPIDPLRLAAQPAASFCRGCKDAFERSRGFIHDAI